MKAKVAILAKLNSPLILDEIEIPTPDVGQVLVRIYASGVCGTQLEEISAKRDSHLPHLLGHEGAGTVVAIGEGVTNVNVDNHVVLHWRKGRGIEADFPKYLRKDGTQVGGGRITTFNEYAIVSENRLTAISKDIPLDVAALMGCAVTTGLGVALKEAELQPGKSIGIIGCGGVGLNVIQGASLMSAWPIYAFDIHEEKLAMAKYFGATHTINLIEHDMLPGKIDTVVDCTGLTGRIEEGLELVAPGGRMILVGLPHGESNAIGIRICNMRQHFTGKKIIFSEGGSTDPNIDIPIYLRMYKAGILKLKELITHRYPLEKINDGLDTLRTGKCGRCIVEMP